MIRSSGAPGGVLDKFAAMVRVATEYGIAQSCDRLMLSKPADWSLSHVVGDGGAVACTTWVGTQQEWEELGAWWQPCCCEV